MRMCRSAVRLHSVTWMRAPSDVCSHERGGDMTVRPRLGHGPTWVGLLALVGGLVACGDTREHVLVPDGSRSFAIMNFTEPLPLDLLPAGWAHRRF